MTEHFHRGQGRTGQSCWPRGPEECSTHTVLPTPAPPAPWLGNAAGPASGSSRVPLPSSPPGGESALPLASSPLPLSSKKSQNRNKMALDWKSASGILQQVRAEVSPVGWTSRDPFNLSPYSVQMVTYTWKESNGLKYVEQFVN